MDQTPEQTRLECLHLAVDANKAQGGDADCILKAAQQYFDFVQGVTTDAARK